ncbi:MAG: IS1595 family transposase [Crocinitomicaceae bacterium]|nr:IS1595 family transposase [Crocinitomicaceae bacterium]MCF8434629.1 IS1595 family transposase [Crocinitomicaceae bacterium]
MKANRKAIVNHRARLLSKYGLPSHEKRFGTEEKCREFIASVRWTDGIAECPQCGNTHMNYFLTTRNIWKCSSKSCRKQFSVIKGTIFENTNIPLVKWFKAVFYFTVMKRGISSCQLARNLEVEQRTAWFILHRLREVIAEEGDIQLSGVVEADETQIGPQVSKDTRLQEAKKLHDEKQDELYGMSKKKKRRIRGEPAKRGRKKGSTKEVLADKKAQRESEKITKGERVPFEKDKIILGMMERDGRVVFKMLGLSNKTRTKEKIYPYLKKHISSNSFFITDDLNLYDDTKFIFRRHETVNHDVQFARGFIHTNNIENSWKHLKKMMDGTYFHASYYHFNRYLIEQAFRWNRLNESNEVLVDDLLKKIVGKRLKYFELIRKESSSNKLAG